MEAWNTSSSSELYRIEGWGAGYYKINEHGNVAVSPHRNDQWVDLHAIVEDLVRRGVKAPHLIRFDGIIRERARQIKDAFNKAMSECEYNGSYTLTRFRSSLGIGLVTLSTKPIAFLPQLKLSYSATKSNRFEYFEI